MENILLGDDSLKRTDINIRDPFILTEGGKYYMYGSRGASCWGNTPNPDSGFDVYVSSDLENWSAPKCIFKRRDDFWSTHNFWAPEVHKYNGKFYMFASFKSENACRGTQVLICDTPDGNFEPICDSPITPRDWECLDGTLHIEPDGTPYIVFCHEWLQVHDGEMCAMPLSDDLTHAVGKPIILFRASEPDWATKGKENYVTDGPFLYRTASGRLIMIWSSNANGAYCEAMSYSDNGSILGKWSHDDRLLFSKDGGHGMIFKALDGKLMFTCHQPNKTPLERPQFFEIEERDGSLYTK